MKSYIKNKKPINWDQTIIIENLTTTKHNLELYNSQINNDKLKLNDIEKKQQISFLIMRENILNHAIEKISEFYEFEIFDEDIENFLKVNNFLNDKNEIRKKIIHDIKKILIIKSIKEDYKIFATDDELKNILNKYNIDNTNNNEFQISKQVLEEEKTIDFIIKKFKIDTSLLENKLYKSLSKLEDK